MRTLLLLIIAVYASGVAAQSVSSNTPDESLVDRSTEGIDYPGCYSDLHKADRNGDGLVKQNEYLNFIQEYGKRICFSTDKLTLQQSATFNSLACICKSQEGSKEDCCIGDNAQIPTSGALTPIADQTPSQKNYLTTVCKLTDATIEGQCPSTSPPVVIPSTPAPITSPPVTSPPVTNPPVTNPPVTNAPVTAAPVTIAPATYAPATVAPATVAPATVAPTTLRPTTVPAPRSTSFPTAGSVGVIDDDGALASLEDLSYIPSTTPSTFPSLVPNIATSLSSVQPTFFSANFNAKSSSASLTAKSSLLRHVVTTTVIIAMLAVIPI